MSKTPKHNELIDLAVKKLSGEAVPNDLVRLEELLEISEENKILYQEINKTWNASEKAKGITRQETIEEWAKLQKAISTNQSTNSRIPVFRIAATLLVLFSIAITLFLISSGDSTTLIAQETTSHTFSDGSVITLKTGAELTYEEGFSEDERVVTLKGEAFFDVARDQDRPFIVHTTSIEVAVLGTSFNVKATEGSPSEVVVTSGKVAVSHEADEVLLEVGEKATLASGRLLKLKNEDPNYLSWKTLTFEFNNVPLSRVITDLNNAYLTSIKLDEAVSNCPITVSFDNQSLESILKVLRATFGLSIEEQGDEIFLSGDGC